MNLMEDARCVERLRESQRGVFSTADLKTALGEKHPAGFTRRTQALVDRQVVRRFTRGFYVTEVFDLAALSQRIAPHSCISFESVLAGHLAIGTEPRRRIVATKVGRARRYEALGYVIEHQGISTHLDFGSETKDGIRYAKLEKALLDVLYFHLRGRRAAFDIYSDINLQRFDRKLLREYLTHYRNPKFVTFAKQLLALA